jgi:hypothetical protein
MVEKCVITFFSLHDVFKAEKILKEKSIEIKIIPVPRTISADCGICIEFDLTNRDRVQDILVSNKIEFESIYQYEK